MSFFLLIHSDIKLFILFLPGGAISNAQCFEYEGYDDLIDELGMDEKSCMSECMSENKCTSFEIYEKECITSSSTRNGRNHNLNCKCM